MKAGEHTREALQRAADAPLIWAGSSAYTGGQIDAAVDGLAAKLTMLALPRTRVGVWAWNSAETIVAHLAIERAGMARVPIDPEAPHAEAASVLDAAGVEALIVDDEHRGALSIDVPAVALDHTIWTTEPALFSPPTVSTDDEALLIVRGVMPGGLLAIPLTIGNWEAHMRLAASLYRDGSFGNAFAANPFFITVQQMQYGTGLLGTFPFIRMGLPQAVLKKFHAEELASTVMRHHATATFAVPGMISRLAESMPDGAPEPWRLTILYGGAPFSLDDMRRAMSVLGPNLIQLYGRFEGGWPLAILSAADHRAIMDGNVYLAGSCGQKVDQIELELRDVPSSEYGELRSRSDCVSVAFTDPDGWCSLGDLASIDDDGYYFLSGRLDNMINTGSFHVYPQEVVNAIEAEFPEATKVRVEGRTDAKWGEAVTAVITWSSDQDAPSEETLRSRLAVRLAKYKLPTRVEYYYSTA